MDSVESSSYKVRYVLLSAAPTTLGNYKKSNCNSTKQMILYRFTIRNLYHLVLTAGV